MQMKTLTIIFLLLSPILLFSQEKFEREYRISKDEIPVLAKDFIQELTSKKVLWLREESQIGTTIEAKFKFQKKKFSIEFDTTGIILDAEYIVKSDQIPVSVWNAIKGNLNKKFDKWKIEKVQIQFSGEREKVLKAIRENATELVTIQYEIILRGKNEGLAKRFEFTFDKNGQTVQVSEIIEENAEHLEY